MAVAKTQREQSVKLVEQLRLASGAQQPVFTRKSKEANANDAVLKRLRKKNTELQQERDGLLKKLVDAEAARKTLYEDVSGGR